MRCTSSLWISISTVSAETVVIEGLAVYATRQRYDGCVQMVDCRFDLVDPFASSVLQLRAKIQAALQTRYVPEVHRQSGLYEDYTILLLQTAKPTPEKWVKKNAPVLAKFFRSQREFLGKEEIDEILASRTHYSARELTLVDWEGAVIIAPNGDFDSDIALLKIGNYQLLLYRMLDESIEAMLDKVNESFFQNKRRPRATRGMIRQIAELRIEVMLDFERAEQNMR